MGNVEFACGNCGKVCKNAAGLSKHMNMMHLILSPTQEEQAVKRLAKPVFPTTPKRGSVMSREIKFRAWDVTDEKMFNPDGFSFEMGISAITVKEVGKLINPNEMSNTYKVMQYTGLKDKNGEEIYEGDIVLVPDSHLEPITDAGEGPVESANHLAEVVFDSGCFLFKVNDGDGDYLDPGTYSYNTIKDEVGTDDLEVIGNIYEHPDLLETEAS